MAILAIKGHATRGKEVIEILEMLGGVNVYNHIGNMTDDYYKIDDNSNIFASNKHQDCILFTLEQFLEKFPYKVGDKVIYNNKPMTITKMVWEEQTNTIAYKLNDKLYCNVMEELQPYTERNNLVSEDEYNTEDIEKSYMNLADDFIRQLADSLHWKCKDFDSQKVIALFLKKNMGINIVNNDCNNKVITFANCDIDEVELDLTDRFEIVLNNGKYYAVRKQPQYPKTCEECLKVLGKTMNSLDNIKGYKYNVLMKFQQLLICRDVYWKIAGDWKPDYEEGVVNTYYTIHNFNNEIFCGGTSHRSAILAFPTEEMRDAFYGNFKELIEQCKELL